ncbi:terminase large subunit [Xanthobacter autotrophicus]|uniref:terminase large subunit n=1 Tax=Xanthobacter autotrophicus TaxID=280 RepID=UPI003727680C
MAEPIWSTACPDWEDRIVNRQSLVPFDPLFPEQAEAGLSIFRDLRITDMAGRPTIGEACRPWVFDLPKALFGSEDPESGRRLIREYLLLVSKKNWKSGSAASVMLTALLRNWRDEAEFLIVAPTIEIANNSFGPAASMVKADDELWMESDGFLKIQPHFRTITNMNNGATLKVIAADSETVSGKKASGIFIDELWLFGKRNQSENMFREVTGGLASRPEGFVIYATTQSDEPPEGVFKSKLEYFRAVRDGKIDDPRSLGILYEYPQLLLKREAYKNPAFWYVTNPNFGASVDEQFIADQYKKDELSGEASLRGFLAKHLNVEINLALSNKSWEGADFWEESGEAIPSLEEFLARCEVVVIGIDGGGLDDLLGLALLGREKGTGKWLAWCRAWAHRIVLQRRKGEASKLTDLEKSGFLTIVDRPGQDVSDIGDIVMQVDGAGLLAEKYAVGVDRAGIGDIVDELIARGIILDRIMGVTQGWGLNGAIKTTARKLAGGDLKHEGSPLMAWCVGNARVEPKGNAITITKQVSGSAKIDPLMALFNAVYLMAYDPQPARKANPRIIIL